MLYGIAGERRYGLSAVDGLVPCAEGNEDNFVMTGKMRCGHTVFTLWRNALIWLFEETLAKHGMKMEGGRHTGQKQSHC